MDHLLRRGRRAEPGDQLGGGVLAPPRLAALGIGRSTRSSPFTRRQRLSVADWPFGSASSQPFAVGQLVLWFWDADPARFQHWIEAWPALADLSNRTCRACGRNPSDLWLLLGLGTLLLVLGLADDRRGVDWRLRLAVQTAGCNRRRVCSRWKLSLVQRWPWVAGLLSLLWIVGLVNSFNMLDNMDGLSAGVGAIAAGMLAAVMLLVPDPQTRQPHLFVAGFLLVLVGSLVGFLWHNRPPGRIFMGDAGELLHRLLDRHDRPP